MSVGKTFALKMCLGYISQVHLRNGEKKFEMLCQHDSYIFENYQLCR